MPWISTDNEADEEDLSDRYGGSRRDPSTGIRRVGRDKEEQISSELWDKREGRMIRKPQWEKVLMRVRRNGIPGEKRENNSDRDNDNDNDNGNSGTDDNCLRAQGVCFANGKRAKYLTLTGRSPHRQARGHNKPRYTSLSN
jgi:hypothetical protein